jgi:DNA invertase Pin-like site-specific DNA recombinase
LKIGYNRFCANRCRLVSLTSPRSLGAAAPGGLADVERDLIRTRAAGGRSCAQKRGQHMGRPPRLTATQKAEARRRRAEGATLAELARSSTM